MALKETSHNQGKHLFELRLVLLGGRNSGKTTVGNAILNQEEFILHERTTCLIRKAKVQGRSVTVVDTPGWWCDFSAQDTPELIRREIRHSVSLSLPGPHVFILVVKTDSVFIEKRRRAVEEHLQLLGEQVWNYTLILFTKGKNTRNQSFEDHVQASGKPLKWLLEKCNGRFYVLDIRETCSPTQVMELMRTIDKMVAKNGRRHFEVEVKSLKEIEDRKKEVELKAHQRMMKTHKQRSALKVNSSHHRNIRLVLLGAKGSGKSSTGNSILAAGSDLRFTAKKRTTRCMKEKFTLAGREVTVVDTPGWWMNYFTHESSAFDKAEIVRSVYLCPAGPNAFLLVVRVDRCFTEIYRTAIKEHTELVSKNVWNHCLVLFTFGDWLGDTTIEQFIESEGKYLQWLVERCGNRYHVLNNTSFGNKFQIVELLEKIEQMTAGNGVSHFKTDKCIFMEIEKKRQEEEDRVKLRRENVLRRRQSLRAFKNQLQMPSDIRVILLGAKRSGKTSSASCILGIDEHEADSQNLIRGTVIFNNTKIEIVDTPGWTTQCSDVNEFSRSLHSDWVSGSTNGICILLLVVNASSSYTLNKLKAAEKHLRALGVKAWSRTLALFTNGDWLGDVSVEEYIECEGEALQTLVDKCGNRYQVFNNKIRDKSTQVAELMQKITEMVLEQMLNSVANRENIEHPLIHNQSGFSESVQPGEAQKAHFKRSTHIQHGYTDILEEHHVTGISDHLLPSASNAQRTTLTDSLLQTENQALVSFSRNFPQRLVVVHNTSEWFHPYDTWISMSRTDGPETEQSTYIKQLLRIESQEERFCVPPLPHRHRNTPAHTAKERAFMDFVQSESLQKLIDQWGESNIEELEAFIDSYFEMVWQEDLKEPKCSSVISISCESSGITENEQGHLASTDKKLSKLDILEAVQRDLRELKQSVKNCSRIFQELKDRNKESYDPSRPSEATVSAESEDTGRSVEK